LIAEMDVNLPAVLGIQASDEPPRYVAVSKVRQVMNTTEIEKKELGDLDSSGGLAVTSMFLPEAAERAEMLDGDEEEIASKLVQIFKEADII